MNAGTASAGRIDLPAGGLSNGNTATRRIAMKRLLSAALLSLSFLAGSATAGTFTDYGGFGKYKRSLADGGGCVSGTVGSTIPGRNYNVIVNFAAHRFSDKAEFNKAYFGFTTLDKKHGIDAGTLRAGAFMLCLEPGEYDIIGIEMLRAASTRKIRLPFTVEAGKNRYLGSLVFHSDPVHILRCSGLPNQSGVEIQDRFARDLPLIMALKGAIAPEPALLDAGQGLPYFFGCPDAGG